MKVLARNGNVLPVDKKCPHCGSFLEVSQEDIFVKLDWYFGDIGPYAAAECILCGEVFPVAEILRGRLKQFPSRRAWKRARVFSPKPLPLEKIEDGSCKS